MTQQKLAELLREKGLRVTSRRLAIAEAFLNSTTSSVQQIYELVYDRSPSVTMAGIYSTLGVPKERGLIGSLSFQKRVSYKANLEPHHTWLALTQLRGFQNVPNYDGSWTEWGSIVGAPIEKP